MHRMVYNNNKDEESFILEKSVQPSDVRIAKEAYHVPVC
jgi:hypothetical protein